MNEQYFRDRLNAYQIDYDHTVTQYKMAKPEDKSKLFKEMQRYEEEIKTLKQYFG